MRGRDQSTFHSGESFRPAAIKRLRPNALRYSLPQSWDAVDHCCRGGAAKLSILYNIKTHGYDGAAAAISLENYGVMVI